MANNSDYNYVAKLDKFQDQLGELSKRARHSLDYLDTLPYLSLPDEINEISDELVVIALLCSYRLLRGLLSCGFRVFL